MPTYIGLLKLTEQGRKDYMNAPGRIEKSVHLQQKMGGKPIGVYMVMGEYDYVVLGEFPSDEVAAAFSLVLSSQGNVKTTTLRAFPANEIPGILQKVPKP